MRGVVATALGTMVIGAAFCGPASARVFDAIPTSFVKVRYEIPGGKAPGQLAKSLVYVDGPILLWRGAWKHPDDIDPIPLLLVPVRVVIPGIYKFLDVDSVQALHGEIHAETYTPEARIYRLLLPVLAMKQTHRFEAVFHAGLRAPFNIVVDFEPPVGLVIRNSGCERRGIDLDAEIELYKRAAELAAATKAEAEVGTVRAKEEINQYDIVAKAAEGADALEAQEKALEELEHRKRELGEAEGVAKAAREKAAAAKAEFDKRVAEPNFVYLFCVEKDGEVQVGVYAPLDHNWTRFGYEARKVLDGRGLYFKVPIPGRGIDVPEEITEFELEMGSGKRAVYILRVKPPWRARHAYWSLALGLDYHHYTETARDFDVLDQVGIFGRSMLGLKLLPQGLDFVFDIQGVIDSSFHSPQDKVSAFQYWSMSSRLGYVSYLPPSPRAEWSVLAGWQYWRLYVNDEKFSYGLARQLMGPQIFVQRRAIPVKERSWWINLRWSFLGRTAFPKHVKDYEVGLGGGFDIAWIGRRRPLSLWLDVSRLQFLQDDSSMTFHSIMVLLGFPIY